MFGILKDLREVLARPRGANWTILIGIMKERRSSKPKIRQRLQNQYNKKTEPAAAP